MKIDVDDDTIVKLMGKKAASFKREIASLEKKIKSRDNKIYKLQRELELYKAGRMDTDKEVSDRIAKVARALVGELQRANWVEKYYGCGTDWTADEVDQS